MEAPHDRLSGLQLAIRFHADVVGPLLASRFPRLRYAAALLGEGSEVLGFDTPMSRDHDWGPRVQLFFSDPAELPAVRTVLDSGLPSSFLGFPVVVGSDRHAPRHRVEAWTWNGFVAADLGFDLRSPITAADWLAFPEQKLRTLSEGGVFHDDIGLETAREVFRYHPRDVWLYLMAAGWNRIGQEEHLVGRAGYVGDELGASLIAARLVRDLMRLCFLIERRYAPYPKWFGTAFAQLSAAAELSPLLHAVLAEKSWQARDSALAAAYECVARLQNALGVCDPRPEVAGLFHDRPFHVIEAHARFADALVAQIEDSEVRRLASLPLVGGIDQLSDSTDLLSPAAWHPKLRRLYNQVEGAA